MDPQASGQLALAILEAIGIDVKRTTVRKVVVTLEVGKIATADVTIFMPDVSGAFQATTQHWMLKEEVVQ